MNCKERIRALREDNDYNQTKIAQLLNIGQRTYCDYELGKTRIPIDSIIILAKFYDVDEYERIEKLYGSMKVLQTLGNIKEV